MMRPPVAALSALLSAAALAAPDEPALGKLEGYPLCKTPQAIEARCLVGMMSRFDEMLPSHKVAKAAEPRKLERAPSEPEIRYRSPEGTLRTIDEYLARSRVTGLLAIRGETILLERYQYARTDAHRMNSMSMAKTVVAMLAGIALAEGKIRSLDDRAEDYVPELRGSAYGATPLRHLLSMTSGVRFREEYNNNDDVAVLARLSIYGASAGGPETVKPFILRERPAGERFSYSSGDTQVLGLVVRGATGRTLAEYLSEKIWQPMGAEADATWIVDKGGYEAAYGGLNAALRDYGRLGMVLANEGKAGDRQVIPAEWIHDATLSSGPSFEALRGGPFFGYGYQTWILPGRRRQFALRGIFQQWIFVDPQTRTVLVQTGVGDVTSGPEEILEIFRAVVEARLP